MACVVDSPRDVACTRCGQENCESRVGDVPIKVNGIRPGNNFDAWRWEREFLAGANIPRCSCGHHLKEDSAGAMSCPMCDF